MTRPASSPPTGSGEVRLDLELAAQAIGELEAVKESLVVLRQDAQEMSRQAFDGQSARDLVSAEAFQLLAEKADGAPGSLGFALDAGISHVEGLIDQLRSDVTSQTNSDASAEASFRAS